MAKDLSQSAADRRLAQARKTAESYGSTALTTAREFLRSGPGFARDPEHEVTGPGPVPDIPKIGPPGPEWYRSYGRAAPYRASGRKFRRK